MCPLPEELWELVEMGDKQHGQLPPMRSTWRSFSRNIPKGGIMVIGLCFLRAAPTLLAQQRDTPLLHLLPQRKRRAKEFEFVFWVDLVFPIDPHLKFQGYLG